MSNFFSTIIGSEGDNENLNPSEHMGVHEHDESGGGEFLGDGLRMTEQPLKIQTP